MRIQALHPEITEPTTSLAAQAAGAATSVTVNSNAGFSANDYTVIGKVGQEGTEIRKVSSLTGTTTLNYVGDALTYAHSIATPITYVKYNQVKFYLGDWSARYSTGTISINKDSTTLTGSGTAWGSITTNYALLLNGKWYDIKSVDSATQITLSDTYTDEDAEKQSYALVLFTSQTTQDIQIEQEYTTWDDTDAIAEDYYRTEYYNSTSTLASPRSSIISAKLDEGFSDFALRSLEDEVLSELRDPDAKRRTREEIDRDLNNALRELLSVVLSDVQEDYLNTYSTIDFTASTEEYKLPEDFKKLTMLWISYNGADYIKGFPMRIGDDIPDASYGEGEPRYYMRDNIIGVKPTPASAVTKGIKIWYERRYPSLVNEGDEIPHLLRDHKRLLIDYALEKAHMAEDQVQKALSYRTSYEAGKKVMAKVLADRDLSDNQSIEIVNDHDLYL